MTFAPARTVVRHTRCHPEGEARGNFAVALKVPRYARDDSGTVIHIALRGAVGLEFLHALSGVDLARVDVAVRIDSDAVHPVELAGIAAGAAEAADHGAVASAQDAQELFSPSMLNSQ